MIRDVIDDLDAVLRRGVNFNNLEKVFSQEKARIVSFLISSLQMFYNYIIVELFNECHEGDPVRPGIEETI
jgi:hypothetical protein